MFRVGDKVHFKPDRHPGGGISITNVFTVGAVAELPNPGGHYVDPYYWGTAAYGWARGKTRLDVAGHPQVVFLEGMPEFDTGLAKDLPDSVGEGWRAFSGAWFQHA